MGFSRRGAFPLLCAVHLFLILTSCTIVFIDRFWSELFALSLLQLHLVCKRGNQNTKQMRSELLLFDRSEKLCRLKSTIIATGFCDKQSVELQ
jgi:hypothetical protein